MNTDRGRAGPGVILCAAVACVAWIAAAGPVAAQNAGNRTALKPAQPAAAANEPFVGPQKPAPAARRVQRNISPRAAGKRPAPALPKPTVVLKPGEVPEMTVDTPTYNFGRVREGTEVVHDFWFTNTGNGPLEILRVKPS